MIALNPFDATLVSELRVLTEIGRSYPRTSRLDTTVTDFATVTLLSATLAQNRRRGWGGC